METTKNEVEPLFYQPGRKSTDRPKDLNGALIHSGPVGDYLGYLSCHVHSMADLLEMMADEDCKRITREGFTFHLLLLMNRLVEELEIAGNQITNGVMMPGFESLDRVLTPLDIRYLPDTDAPAESGVSE